MSNNGIHRTMPAADGTGPKTHERLRIDGGSRMFAAAKRTYSRLSKWLRISPAARMFKVSIRQERLQEFFRFARLRVFDVGARSGAQDQLETLAPFAHLYVCDADSSEAERLEQDLRASRIWADATVVRGALAGKSGEAPFYLMRRAGLSSLLRLNEDEASRYSVTARWDGLDRVTTVPCLTLDEAFERHGMHGLSFLKLDTQGSEFDILKSGQNLVLPSVVAIHVEVEFAPLYQGQGLFHDIHAFLEQRGFRLVDLKRVLSRRSVNPRPLYSKREMLWGEALYFRHCTAEGCPLPPEQSVRLCCIATAFEFFDHALCLVTQPETKNFLRLHGFEDIERDLLRHANKFWSILNRRAGLRLTSLAGDKYMDVLRER